MKVIILGLVMFGLSFSSYSQSEDEIVTFAARICKSDSVQKILGFISEEDSVLTFNVQVPERKDIGSPFFEFDDFNLNFDVNSNHLFSDNAYGKIYIKEFKKGKALIIITIAGAGDRAANNKWTYAEYSFNQAKNGRWMMVGSKYIYEEYNSESNKSSKSKKKGK